MVFGFFIGCSECCIIECSFLLCLIFERCNEGNYYSYWLGESWGVFVWGGEKWVVE